jgi:hypothetical protein
VLILGLVCLVAWRAVQLFTGDEVEGSGLQDRLKYFGMAVVYTMIIGIATTVLLQSFGVGGGGGSGEDPEEEATAFVLDWPGGEFLVGAAGLGFIVVGLFGMYTYGIRAEFMDRIDRQRTGQVLEHKIQVIGRVGYVGRSVVNLVIGFLVILAAVRHDPDEASGMPEALGKLADETWGVALLLFIGLGFFLYATLRLIEARYRKDSRAG